MSIENTKFSLCDDEIRVWVEQEAIHIKAVDKSGDPVEITKSRALELAEALKRLAATIELDTPTIAPKVPTKN
jgi:hypothetical protein